MGKGLSKNQSRKIHFNSYQRGKPIHLFITRGAGIGKSNLMTTIYLFFINHVCC